MSRWSTDPTDALNEQREWLSTDGEKIVICDVAYHTGTESRVGYFSNYPYITPFDESFTSLLGDTVNNIPYIDNLINIPNIISKIDSDINIGAIEFLNAAGEYDDYLNYAWEGWPLKIYIGGKDWRKEDFILILQAISSVISSPRPNIMSLGIRDKKEVFNVKAQTTLIDEAYVSALYASAAPAFTKYLDNLITRSQGIKVLLTGQSSYSAARVAEATANALSGFPEFSIAYTTGNTTFSIDQVIDAGLPPLEAAHDGDDEGTTAFLTSFTGFGTIGGTWPYSQTIDTSLGETNLNNRFFHLYSPFRTYYVWYSVYSTNNSAIAGSVDPEVVDVAKTPFNAGSIRVPDTIVNTAVPICLGKCFNIEPKLIDSNNHVYQVHEKEIDSILEVRANGVVLDAPGTPKPQYEVNASIGCFRLLVHQQSTQITCDVLGDPNRGSGYSTGINIEQYSAAHLVEWLALEKTELIGTDICPAAFDSSAFVNTSPLGLYIKDEIQIAPLITDIMSSVGGFARFDRTCVLQIFRLENPEDGVSRFTIDEDLIIEKGISLGLTEAPKATITLGYDKNWTLQDKASLAGLITNPTGDFLEFLDLYTHEYSTVLSENVGIKDQFPLAEDQSLVGTLISDFGGTPTNNAKAEVDRRMQLRQKKRFVYKISSTVAPFTLSIGDIVTVVHSRFGFSNGKQAIIIGMDEKPTKLRVDLEVWL